MKLNFFGNKNNKLQKTINIFFAIFCIGMVLIIFSKNFKVADTNKEVISEEQYAFEENNNVSTYSESIEKKLEEELAKIAGVGKVEVVITIKTKGEIVLNKDNPSTSSTMTEEDYQGGTRKNEECDMQETTVLINNGDGSEEPIIVKELVPEVNGILIIAEGADEISIRNNLINAAKVLLDLPAHKIEVMKMVSN